LRIANKFLITLVVTFGIANVVLALAGTTRLDTYFVVDTIIFLVLALYFNLGSKAMSALRGIGAFLTLGFLVLVFLRIIEML
jgi:hypothetical protein